MALLTAEDVLNKAFSKTKYREGFDQDEVDDFLDEVASTIAALTAERDELQLRLAQGGGYVAPAQAAAAPSLPVGGLLAAATDPNPPSATTMLAMAQKLHDDYVQAGESERERILNEAKAKAEQIVEQAERDARDRIGNLDNDRAELERRIDDLRRFERDYRGHLRNYLENLLGDLEHSASRGATEASPVLPQGRDEAPAPAAPAATLASDAPSRRSQAAAAAAAAPAQEPSSFAFTAPAAPTEPTPAPTVTPAATAAAFDEFAAAVPEPQAPSQYSPYGANGSLQGAPGGLQGEPPRWNQ